MSAHCRTTVAKLRRKYATTFDLPIDAVEVQEWPDDDATVGCPSRPDLPTWGTGQVTKAKVGGVQVSELASIEATTGICRIAAAAGQQQQHQQQQS